MAIGTPIGGPRRAIVFMKLDFKDILVTGAAGFIGYHLSKRLLEDGYNVIGVDIINDYYDVRIKHDRLSQLEANNNFTFHKIDISDSEKLNALFKSTAIDVVVNLAAQAGVRYSLVNPQAYVDSNLVGFVNILECCRNYHTKHLVFASSSSVYGANTKMPFSVHDNIDHPVSLYAASKKSNELMAHSYSHLFDLACTGLRFFTVYGPWGRPDMALFLFTKAILEGNPINVYNHGKMQRDFTYIDDIVEGIVRVMKNVPDPNPHWSGDNPVPGTSYAKYKIYNIGNNKPVQLSEFINEIEKCINKDAIKNYMDIQPGDVPATYANVDDLIEDVGFKPATPLSYGIKQFVNWYKEHYLRYQ